MTRLQGLCRTFTNNYARGHCVAGRYARQDRAICNTKVLDSVHLELAVNDGHLVSAHLGSTGLMLVACRSIPDKVFEFETLQVAWHDFALDERTKRSRITDFAAELHAG